MSHSQRVLNRTRCRPGRLKPCLCSVQACLHTLLSHRRVVPPFIQQKSRDSFLGNCKHVFRSGRKENITKTQRETKIEKQTVKSHLRSHGFMVILAAVSGRIDRRGVSCCACVFRVLSDPFCARILRLPPLSSCLDWTRLGPASCGHECELCVGRVCVSAMCSLVFLFPSLFLHRPLLRSCGSLVWIFPWL
jgi:hypothetical protein